MIEILSTIAVFDKFRVNQQEIKPICSCESGGQFVIRNQFRFSHQKQKLYVLSEAVGKSCLPQYLKNTVPAYLPTLFHIYSQIRGIFQYFRQFGSIFQYE
ncbi:hypothetical protein C5Q97_01715 [Victivallales bacterium CCUG 44730]|nr:hypothetical protein C5Q97_01715 [Victivallales bacterium CCUG 44730]